LVEVNPTAQQCKGCANLVPNNYNQSVQLALQSLNVPCFEFEIPQLPGASTYDILRNENGVPSGYRTCSEKYVLVKAPTCVPWTIRIDNRLALVEGQPPLGSVTWTNVPNVGISVTASAANVLLGTTQVPNTQPCGSGQGNNVIPLGTSSNCTG
jgi:hypothetical protein